MNKVKLVTPIGSTTFAPWLLSPSKWNNAARDGDGGSEKCEVDDIKGSYSVGLAFPADEFEKSPFKKTVDDLWGEHVKAHKGKFDEERPPYELKDGKYVVKASAKVGYEKNGKAEVFKRPYVMDCSGKDLMEHFDATETYPAADSDARIQVTCYMSPIVKHPHTKKKLVKMTFNLVGVQFQKLVSTKAEDQMDAISGEPVMAGMDADPDEIPF